MTGCCGMSRIWLVVVSLVLLCVVASSVSGQSPRAVEMGKAALADGFYETAEMYLRSGLDHADPGKDRDELVYYLAKSLRKQSRFTEALELLSRAPTDASFEAAYILERAFCFYGDKKYIDALKLLDDLGEEKNAIDPLRLRIRCLSALHRESEALDLIETTKSRYTNQPDYPYFLLDQAALLLKLDRAEEAGLILEQVKQQAVDSSVRNRALLWEYTSGERNSEEPRKQFLQILEDSAADYSIKKKVAVEAAALYAAQTNYNRAFEILESVQSTNLTDAAQHADLVRYRAYLLMKMGNVQQAQDELHAWVSRYPDEQELQIDWAMLLEANGLYETAAAEYQIYLESFAEPQQKIQALLGRGRCLLNLGRTQEAAGVFERIYNESQDESIQKVALLRWADALYGLEEYEEARKLFQQYPVRFPGDEKSPSAMYRAAECLARMGEWSDAEKDFQAIEDAFSGSQYAQEAAFRRGLMKEEEGLWGQAESQYDLFLKKYPDSTLKGRVLLARGLVQYRLGLFDEALVDFEAVRTLNSVGPHYRQQAYYMKSWCLYLLGNIEEALSVCQDFLSRFSDSEWAADVRFWIGEQYYNQEDYQQAEPYFSQVAEMYPRHDLADEALLLAGRCAAIRKEYMRASRHFGAIVKQYPDSPKIPAALLAQGDVYSELGNFDVAIIAFETVVKEHPESYQAILARGRIGDCNFTLGAEHPSRYEEALASYTSMLSQNREIPRDLRLQVLYKIGRTQERLGRPEEAFARYMEVFYDVVQGDTASLNDQAIVWFTRAAFDAAGLKERADDYLAAYKIYEAVKNIQIPASEEAERRIRRLQMEPWKLIRT